MAVLIALARRPGGRATLHELSEDVTLIADIDEKNGNTEQPFALDLIEVFRSGFVAAEDDSLWITENGWSLLRTLGIPAQDHGAQPVDQNTDLTAPHDNTGGLEARSSTPPQAAPRRPAAGNDRRPADDAITHHSDGEIASGAPAALIHKFGSGLRDASPSSNFMSRLTQRMQEAIRFWHHHLQRDQLPTETRRSGAKIERGLLVLLSLLAIVSCAGAVTALMQVRSLKSELTALQRELLPLKERVAKLGQIEKSKEASDQASGQNNQPSRENRAEEAALLLSREEIQLVRDYIKPAPLVDSSTAPISVGDPITGPTIPFPSALTEKISKLIGARFAIRNGAIVILKKDSRRADAVLGPN
ncbi:hypothetical protein [Bradyrhizobium sp. SSUT77]|uniref:hypothetical protein n=1 Tax=Bradyrhizobium sp. SSUT77 TaxID=3040603 RepID=UPI00244D74A6|nr:hypothetical protein [Bradyrhizobium sp. SSUT77]MDH2347557.1 hypothetical protein [Bradyrhizobium sp. SSUT77]